MKMRRRIQKAKIHRVVILFIGFIISCLLVPKFSSAANEIRGYKAFGGEAFIPLLYLATIALIREIGDLTQKEKHSRN